MPIGKRAGVASTYELELVEGELVTRDRFPIVPALTREKSTACRHSFSSGAGR